MNTEILSSLNEDTVLLVYQLAVFSKSEHCFVHIIISQCHDFLQFIIEHYIKSFLLQCFSLSSYSILKNSISQREKSVDLDFLQLKKILTLEMCIFSSVESRMQLLLKKLIKSRFNFLKL